MLCAHSKRERERENEREEHYFPVSRIFFYIWKNVIEELQTRCIRPVIWTVKNVHDTQ